MIAAGEDGIHGARAPSLRAATPARALVGRLSGQKQMNLFRKINAIYDVSEIPRCLDSLTSYRAVRRVNEGAVQRKAKSHCPEHGPERDIAMKRAIRLGVIAGLVVCRRVVGWRTGGRGSVHTIFLRSFDALA